MLYVLDHYYFINHSADCLLVQSDEYELEDVVEICSAMAFLLEETVDDSASLAMECLMQILETYFGFVNRKSDISEDILDSLELPIDSVAKDIFLSDDGEYQESYVVDLYAAREYCCGHRYEKVMKKWCPEGARLEEIKKLLLAIGVEE